MRKADMLKVCNVHNLGTYKTHNLLGQGENHINFLIETATQKIVLRKALRKDHTRIEKEHKMLQEVKHFAPKSLIFDKTTLDTPFTIQEFIKGKHPKRISTKLLVTHAKQLAKIHNQTQRKPFTFDIYKHFKENLKQWETYKEVYDKELMDKLLQIMKTYNVYFKNIPKTLVHQDIVRTNMLVNKDSLTYIDWEWANFRDPARDLASMYYPGFSVNPWHINLSKDREKLFLNTYKKLRPKDTTLLNRIRAWQLFVMAIDYNYFVWKLHNWKTDIKSDLPKKVYKEGKNKIEKHLKKLILNC